MGFIRDRLFFVAVLIAALIHSAASQAQQPAAPPEPPVPFDQAKALAELRKSIQGKEDQPADDVFMNVKVYKAVTAERFLRIMEFGFSQALGVTCTHCHVPGQWDADDKGAKETARAMSAMVTAINNEYLKKIPTLNGANPSVNCTTCHRGQKRPALEMPPAAPVPAVPAPAPPAQ